jgi:hypothetical protein
VISGTPIARDLAGFLCDELGRDKDPLVRVSARMLRKQCVQASLVASAEGVFVILWLRTALVYRLLANESVMAALAETAGQYTQHVAGFGGMPRVVLGYGLKGGAL